MLDYFTCSVGGVGESFVDILKLVASVQRASAVRTNFKDCGTNPNQAHRLPLQIRHIT